MSTVQVLMEANKRLGEAITQCSEEEKAIVAGLYDQVKAFAAEQESKGVLCDKAAFFAAAIILNTELENEELFQAAVNYVDQDWLFTKAEREGQPT